MLPVSRVDSVVKLVSSSPQGCSEEIVVSQSRLDTPET